MNSDIRTIDFHGDSLVCVLKDDVPHVSVRHVCDALGIALSAQLQKLKASPWATVSMIDTVGGDGKDRELAMIPVKSLAMWMATVNPRKVGADVRSKLERYQVEAADVLDRYFRRGERFVAAGAAGGDGDSLLERLIRQADLIQDQAGAFRQSLVLAAENERRLADAEARVGSLERRAAADAVARLVASEELRALPPPTVALPEKTPIDDVGRMVKSWAGKSGVSIAEAWRRFYEEVRIRLHFDAAARLRKYPHGFRKADVLRIESPEGVGLDEFHAQVYAIAYALFAGPAPAKAEPAATAAPAWRVVSEAPVEQWIGARPPAELVDPYKSVGDADRDENVY